MHTARPSFRQLDPFECAALMGMQNVGRLAYVHQDRVDIVPIHYVWSHGWIYGRTGAGQKLRALVHNPWVAFEIDEINGLFDWRSVVVRGTLTVLSPTDDGPTHGEWDHAVELLRRIVPEAFTADDPVSDRAVVFRIRADQVTGRGASP
jgi:nitroimidazol reductase NimA-like FMN-containing flavoprotein (pyridoxamine 5'-phosphate oxidase superfamily)